MSIWFQPLSLDALQASCSNTLVDHLGIEFTGFTDDTLSVKMPVDKRTRQPFGIMHGGASCVLAETVASVAGNCVVNPETHYVVGLEINTSHVRMAKDGFVYATAIPLHLGKTTQLWEINILDEQGKLISINRLRLSVLSH